MEVRNNMTYSHSRTVGRRWTSQIVYVQNPQVSSPAALVLLSRMYSAVDKSFYTTARMHRIRTRWMKSLMKSPDEKGGLTCAICGKKGLLPFTSNSGKLATLDHIVSISNGGSWYDTNNFQVACRRCNNGKV